MSHPLLGAKVVGVECLTCHTEGPWTISNFDQPAGSGNFVIRCDRCGEPTWAEASLVAWLYEQVG